MNPRRVLKEGDDRFWCLSGGKIVKDMKNLTIYRTLVSGCSSSLMLMTHGRGILTQLCVGNPTRIRSLPAFSWSPHNMGWLNTSYQLLVLINLFPQIGTTCLLNANEVLSPLGSIWAETKQVVLGLRRESWT